MRLVVAVESCAGAVEDVGAVEIVVLALPHLDAHRTHHERDAQLARQGLGSRAEPRIGVEGARHRGLGPHDEARASSHRLPRQILVGAHGLVGEFRAPLHALVDVALEQPDANRAAVGRISAGVRKGSEPNGGGGHGERRERPPRANSRRRREAGPHESESRASEGRHEREPHHPGVGREAEQPGVLVLGIADDAPRKPAAERMPPVVECGPEHSEGERPRAPPLGEPPPRRSLYGGERRHVEREPSRRE